MEEKKELIKSALVEFFKTVEGGYPAVASKIGLSEQTLYNAISGRNMVKLDTLLLIKEAYGAQFEPVLLKIMGLGAHRYEAGSPNPEPPLSEDGVSWKERYYEVCEKYNDLEARFAVVAEQVNGLTKQNKLLEFMYSKLDPSFTGSSSHFTAMMSAYKQIGFEYCKNIAAGQEIPAGVVSQKEECIEMPMYPASNLTIFGAVYQMPISKQA